jgi:hypothetical protein
VFGDRRPEHLDAARAMLRNGLRAKWRQLGNDRDLLVAECGYEQWHRLLFARFLAENGLLLHPQYRAPVTLAECEELAPELGEPDGWSVAARFAAEILPGIFRLDDPGVRLRLAPEGRQALEQILDAIPAETFAADDALGWVYQFWQKDKKDEVNASERKIGGADLGPVTQLFTENYMVRFLLENSLGAWWAARRSDSPLVKGFDYLRFDEDGKPAAGAFEGWPERVAEVTVMDPCCGSGHFLIEAFSMLWQMRAEEEGLTPVEAQDAVLRDNLFGLELDSRCVQIAMFNVALQAWKAGGGWRQLPVPNIACSGIPVKAPVEEWKKLAGGDQRLESALVRLHILFGRADTLGSLIDPRSATELDPLDRQRSLEDVEWTDAAPLVIEAVMAESIDPATAVLGMDAAAIARASDFLARSYTLIATNVPYLLRRRQAAVLAEYCDSRFTEGSGDIATTFAMRCLQWQSDGCTIAIVLPNNWTNLTSQRGLRKLLLTESSWRLFARLGTGAFETISGEVVNVVLWISNRSIPDKGSSFVAIDVSNYRYDGKKEALRALHLLTLSQAALLRDVSARIVLSVATGHPELREFADSYQGTTTGDNPRWVRCFWEVGESCSAWTPFQSTVDETTAVGGRSLVLWWGDRGETYRLTPQARLQGQQAWGRVGVTVSQMGGLGATRYSGNVFDMNSAAIIPGRESILPAIWAYVSSNEFPREVRLIDQSIKVTNATFLRVPFDVDRWQKVAEEAGPLPELWSDDPTQWLFKGRPDVSTASLQVAVARLVSYRWPEQPESDGLEVFADADGIVCLPAVAGEPPAADRVQQLLVAAFGDLWSLATVKALLEQAGSKKKNLADWLRDEFFKQHCALFGNRPFVWHVWDGQREGFSALVNYHRLDRKTLERLTYTYLGQDWVERQRAEVRDGAAGAEARLAAALALQKKLQAILEGEAPLDIYVRWKEIEELPVGWEPDVNDGVRLNIRPFVEADVLRTRFNIHWRKDRGKNPDGSERHNDIHLPLAKKLEARRKVSRS